LPIHTEHPSLISLARKAQHQDKEAMLAILQRFQPKIERSLYQTSYEEREDLRQHLCLKVMEAVHNYRVQPAPSFWELYQVTEIARESPRL
jgi:DNA-directed RNA polymerase specialized sigma24 family protein